MTEQEIQLFDSYINDLLSAGDRLNFEKKLQTDSDFKINYEAYLTSVNLLKINAFKKHVILDYKRPHTRFSPKVITIGVIILAALISLLIFLKSQKIDEIPTNELFAQYFEPLPDLISTRSESNSLLGAMESYNDREYGKALESLDTTLFKQSQVKVYRAICRLAIDEEQNLSFEDEIRALKHGHPLEEQVRWYQALSHVKNGELNKGVLTLESIDEGTYKYNEAKQLLIRLTK